MTQNVDAKSKRSAKKVKKPRVIGIVIVLFLKAFLLGFLTLTSINQINEVIDNPAYIVESWALPLNYALFAIAIASFVAAVLIFTYRRIGLIIGGGFIVIELIIGGFSLLSGRPPSLVDVILSLLGIWR